MIIPIAYLQKRLITLQETTEEIAMKLKSDSLLCDPKNRKGSLKEILSAGSSFEGLSLSSSANSPTILTKGTDNEPLTEPKNYTFEYPEMAEAYSMVGSTEENTARPIVRTFTRDFDNIVTSPSTTN